MENRQYNNHKTSDLCTGYGTGLSCVACCCDIGAPCWPGPEVTGVFAIDLNERISVSLQICRKDEYFSPDTIKLVKQTFQHNFKLFNDMIEKNTSSFEAKIKKGFELEEIAKIPGNFLGNSNCKIGCLLYPKDSLQKDCRLSMCRSYLCDLAKYYQGSEISDFVKENKSKLNTFIYSRMIHTINNNPPWLNNLLQLNISFGKDRKECMSDLDRLLEIVKI